MIKQAPHCKTCRQDFVSWYELAVHLDRNKTTHKLSYGTKKWIARMMMVNTLSFDKRRELPKKVAQNPDHERTEYGIEQRANAVRVLTGETEYIDTHCPQCNKGSRQLLPAEYVQSGTAWRNKMGLLMVNCQNCQKRGG